jgi:hypothetical protein
MQSFAVVAQVAVIVGACMLLVAFTGGAVAVWMQIRARREGERSGPAHRRARVASRVSVAAMIAAVVSGFFVTPGPVRPADQLRDQWDRVRASKTAEAEAAAVRTFHSTLRASELNYVLHVTRRGTGERIAVGDGFPEASKLNVHVELSYGTELPVWQPRERSNVRILLLE